MRLSSNVRFWGPGRWPSLFQTSRRAEAIKLRSSAHDLHALLSGKRASQGVRAAVIEAQGAIGPPPKYASVVPDAGGLVL